MDKTSVRVALVTGASSGIGLAIAKRLSSEGWKVYGIARRAFFCEDFECLRADVNDLDGIRSVFEEVLSREGRIDAVINNAGFGIAGAVELASPESIRKIFETNLISLAAISSLAVGYLKPTKGRIVNIGSVAGELPIPFQACYSSTKAGVLSFTLALDNEVRRFGVRAIVVQPGDTHTGFTEARVIEGGEGDYSGTVGRSVRRMEHDEQNGRDPDTVARVVSKALKRKDPPLKITVGASYRFLIGLGKLLPLKFVNFVLRKLYA